MHKIEPYYNWRDLYIASEDNKSPFYERVYSEFEFSNKVYNYYIHPQWDDFGSETLYLKVLYVDYFKSFAIIELIGEWNDSISNDVMHFKRNVIDILLAQQINKFILIGENVLNFHLSDDCYYEEWYEEVRDNKGWVIALNFREHVLAEMEDANLDYYLSWHHELTDFNWRKLSPLHLYYTLDNVENGRGNNQLGYGNGNVRLLD